MLLLVAVGCHDQSIQRVGVRGTVRLDGRPLSNGRICFVPAGATKGPEAATAVMDGKYELPSARGPVVGHHRVEVFAAEAVDYPLDDPQAARRAGGELLPQNLIPPKYNLQSILTAHVTADEAANQFDFHLTTGPSE